VPSVISGGGVNRPFGLALDGLRPTGETLTAHADAVADRLAAGKNIVEVGVRRIDDDSARRLVARIFDDTAPQIGPDLVPVIGRSVAETEPSEWIGRCFRDEGARGNDYGGGSRKPAEIVHDSPLFPDY
jgi:hypothetical protein